ncbi:MAG: DUF6036 family nucleotidyltransferase [Nitrososphaerales archaeon]
MQGRGTKRSQLETNSFSTFNLSREALDVICYIQEEFQKPVWLLGLHGLYCRGVPYHRTAEDITIYSPITKPERSELDDYLRNKYSKIVGRRSDRGTTYSFPHSCLLIVNRVDVYIETYCSSSPESLEQNRVEIAKGVYVQVPQVEDLVIMKLMTGRTKDLRDIRHALRTTRSRIDMNNLESRAREVGADSKLKRIQRIA